MTDTTLHEPPPVSSPQRRPLGRRLRRCVPAGSVAAMLMLISAGSALADGLLLGEDGDRKRAPVVASAMVTEVSGTVAHTRVRQVFRNDEDTAQHARYLFPLPDTAAIDSLTLRYGHHVIEGEIREKQAARREYETAKNEGRKAALLDQNRPNLFTTRIANLEPGVDVKVDMTFQTSVAPRDGVFELRLPQVVTPRFQPPMSPLASADGVPTWDGLLRRLADRNDIADKDGSANAVGHSTMMAIRLQPGLPVEMIRSPSHEITVRDDGENGYFIYLADGGVPADRDFVLQWSLERADDPKAAIVTEQLDGYHYLLAVIAPPKPAPGNRMPRDVSFIIDTSGSMEGVSIRQARIALASAVSALEPEDRFDVIRFDDMTERLFNGSRPASAESKALALRYVDSLSARGGTMMRPALETALGDSSASGANRQIIFLTDGAVGNEAELFGLVSNRLGAARLFTVGIGPAPNSWFMRKAAEFGRGLHLHVDRPEDAAAAIGRLYDKISRPSLTDIEVLADNGRPGQMYPAQLSDLYAGDPIVAVMRFDALPERLVFEGRLGDETWRAAVAPGAAPNGQGIGKLWARRKIEDLMDLRNLGADEAGIRNAVLEVALPHRLVSRYTSFVAVEQKPPQPDGASLDGNKARVMKAASVQVQSFQTADGWQLHLLIGLAGLMLAAVLWTGLNRAERRLTAHV
ncbi:MAG: marine proteobacterial sortase target protein [Alphaproteobacteria bacterium]